MSLFQDLVRLFSFLRHHSSDLQHARRSIAFVVAAGVASGLSTTLLLGLINHVLHADSGPTSLVVLAFGGLCLLLPASRFVSGWLLTKLLQRSALHLRHQLSRRIVQAPLRTLETLGSHRLLAALTNDIPTIAAALTTIPVVCMNFAIVVGSMAYLAWLSPVVFAVAFAFIALGVASYHLPNRWAIQYFAAGREAWDAVFDCLQALTHGTKELKQHRGRRSAFFDERLLPHLERLRALAVRGDVTYAAVNSWGQALFFILIGLLLFAVPAWSSPSLEVLSGYTIVILYMMTPLEMLLNTLPELGQAAVAVDKIDRLDLRLDTAEAGVAPAPVGSPGGTTPEGKTPEANPPGGNTRGNGTPGDGAPTRHAPDLVRPDQPRSAREDDGGVTLNLTGVTYAYDTPGGFQFGPVDFRVAPGEMVFVTGGNGSGKTTFAKLLLGLYAPTDGAIRVGETRVTDATRDDYRQLFSVVFADSFLFDALLGIEGDAVDADAQAYLKQLRLDRKVTVDAAAFSTTDLSTGQRKRLSLLTALLEDRPVYVLDEWAADQDPVFKEVFYHQLLPELKARGKAVVAISHDDRYYDVADRVVKLENGCIVDETQGAASESRPVGRA